ncbi:hypothetical protein ACFCV3_35845 [Kribbella sp. NPDC056345]|uniref:hypothetical protein n=1 Tax=Kribbella sp. NPDC056345 TaxID=3345789 RepID=UPI0035E01832
MRGQIAKDHDQLVAPEAPDPNWKPKPGIPADKQKPKMMDSPFDPKDKHGDPADRVFTIRKEIVEAIRAADPIMKWGGQDLGGASGDLMHFELNDGVVKDKGVYSRKPKKQG